MDHLASGRGVDRDGARAAAVDLGGGLRRCAAGDEGRRRLAHFHWLLGRAAQGLVLAAGAWDGLLLCGGLLGEHADLLAESDFETAFTAHTAHGEPLAQVPMARIAHAQPGLLGAACLALEEP